MTDVLDRSSVPASSFTAPRPAAAPLPREPRTPFALSMPGRVLLAVLSAAAGIVHLAMVPSHWEESIWEGIGFAATGWVQLVIAVLLFVRPTPSLLRVTMLANLAFVAVWVVSRTWGLPFGEHAWHPHDASFVDLACVGIELGIIGAAGVLLVRPGIGRDWGHGRLALASIVPLAVVALTTAALASPSARDHGSASHGGHGHDEAAVTSGGGAGAHDHAAAGDDKGLSLLQNGHQHDSGQIELDNATQAALSAQLAQTAKLIEKYPNIAAAEAAGYRRAGPFSPGLGTHYAGFGAAAAEDMLMGVDGPMIPQLIFDGVEPDSPLAGFMYMSFAGKGKEPEGFIGPNDHWHYHTNTCVVFRDGRIEAPLGADNENVTKKDCDAVGGAFLENTGYMVHVWTVPGYESPRGIFSEINPKITCPDGTYYTVRDNIGFRASICRNP